MNRTRVIAPILNFALCALSFTLPSTLWALQITSPAPNSTLAGPTVFQVDTNGNNNIVAVEYLFNGQPFSGRLATPFIYNWNAVTVWNTQATVTAVGYDINGSTIAEDNIGVTFYVGTTTSSLVANPSQPAILTLQQPNLSTPLSGQQVQWVINENFTVGGLWDCTIDGVQLFGYPLYTGAPFTYPMDTTLLNNGPHTFFCHLLNAGNNASLAMQYWPFTVENPTSGPGTPEGTPDSQIRMNYREIYLVVGETATLTAYAVTNTGQALGLNPLTFSETYEPELITNPWFAVQHPVQLRNQTATSVGVVAISSGITVVTAYSPVYKSSATARITVNQTHSLWHFSTGGQFLSSYVPGQSIFLRSQLAMGLDDWIGPPAVVAAINNVEPGIYDNPADGSQSQNIPLNQLIQGAHNQQLLDLAVKYDMSFHFTGDGIPRTTNELWDSVYDDTSTAKIQYQLAWARDTGRTTGIEMVDETDGAWGGVPNPAQPSFAGHLPPNPGEWITRTPSIGDDAFFRLMDKMNAVTNRPKITWPTLGSQLNYFHTPDPANWMGDPRFADYATLYTTMLGPDSTFPDHGALDMLIRSEGGSFDFGPCVLNRERPMLGLGGITGPTYIKLGPGSQCDPALGETCVSTTPQAVAAQLTYAAIRGLAGLRSYFYEYDTSPVNPARSIAPISSDPNDFLQTGTNSYFIGVDRWRAYSSASNVLKTLEPYLLQPQKNAPDLGPNMATTVRESTNTSVGQSRMLMVLNYSEGPKTMSVDLSPYLYTSSGTSSSYFKRYHQEANQDSQETVAYSTLANGGTDYITIQGGESVAWLFLPNQNTPPNTIPPDTPTGLTAQTSSYIEINLAWTENGVNNGSPNTDPDAIKDYLVYRNGIQVAVATAPFFQDGGLTGSTTYFYQVKARDINGLVSALSNAAWATTFATPDLTEPWIKNVQVSSITTTTAIVTWTTDKLSDSSVAISSEVDSATNKNDFNFGATPFTSSSMTISHAIQLTGLASGTVYHFKVQSVALSNGMVAQTIIYSFTTLFNGPIVGAIRINAGGPAFVDKSSHTWIADEYYDIGFGSLPLLPSTTIQNTTDNTIYLKEHITNSGLVPQNFTYTVPLANGYYNVRLDFAETACYGQSIYDGVGCRVFNTTLNGQAIISNLDMFNTFGPFYAYNWATSQPLKITDKKITISFTGPATQTTKQPPMVSGIEIILNCSDSTTMPTPNLSGVPTILPVDGQMLAKYDPTCNIDHFEWTLIPGTAQTLPTQTSGTASASLPAPALAFATPSISASLALQRPVPPGYYRVGVKAVSEAGSISPEGVAFVQLIGDQLGNARVYPNPWRADRHAQTTQGVTFDLLTLTAKVRIFDIAGHHVRSLTPTGGATTWDLKNDSGQDVASGIYIYLLTDDNGQKARGKLVVIR